MIYFYKYSLISWQECIFYISMVKFDPLNLITYNLEYFNFFSGQVSQSLTNQFIFINYNNLAQIKCLPFVLQRNCRRTSTCLSKKDCETGNLFIHSTVIFVWPSQFFFFFFLPWISFQRLYIRRLYVPYSIKSKMCKMPGLILRCIIILYSTKEEKNAVSYNCKTLLLVRHILTLKMLKYEKNVHLSLNELS